MLKRPRFNRKPKSLLRGANGSKPYPGALRVPKKRRKKGELTKLKDQLWQLCREIQIKKYGRVCYTCGKTVEKSKGLHLGHYITSSLCSVPLRYDLRNLRPQCYHCNINLSGNWPAYKEAIEKECGPDITETLLAFNRATKGKVYNPYWFQECIADYQKFL